MPNPNEMISPGTATKYLADGTTINEVDLALEKAAGQIRSNTSAANTAGGVTVTAVALKSHHLTGFRVVYSDASSHDITVTITQNTTAETFVVPSGAAFMLTGIDWKGDVNTLISVIADAGGVGVTSFVQTFYHTVTEPVAS